MFGGKYNEFVIKIACIFLRGEMVGKCVCISPSNAVKKKSGRKFCDRDLIKSHLFHSRQFICGSSIEIIGIFAMKMDLFHVSTNFFSFDRASSVDNC